MSEVEGSNYLIQCDARDFLFIYVGEIEMTAERTALRASALEIRAADGPIFPLTSCCQHGPSLFSSSRELRSRPLDRHELGSLVKSGSDTITEPPTVRTGRLPLGIEQ